MANFKKEVRKFGKYSTDQLLYEIDRSGEGYTIDSEFDGTGYALMRNDTLVLIGGKNGAFSVSLSDARDFLNEALGVVDILEARKLAGIKRKYYQE